MGKERAAGSGAGRQKVRELADGLVRWRLEVVEIKDGLRPGSTVRSGLECVLADRIQPAVDDLIVLSREPER